MTWAAVHNKGQSVEEYLCQHQHVWGENDRYFDRCAAGLGMIDATLQDGDSEPMSGRQGSGFRRRSLEKPFPVEECAGWTGRGEEGTAWRVGTEPPNNLVTDLSLLIILRKYVT